MNIFGIKNYSNCNINFNRQKHCPSPLSPLKYDTVSFSAKNKRSTESFSKGIEFGKELISLYNQGELTLENIQSIINEKSPIPTKIKSFKERPKELAITNADAYMHPSYNEDMKMENAVIYVDLENIKNNPTQLIITLAHEYTHIMQRYEQDDYMGLKKYTNNLGEARLANYIQNQASGNLLKKYSNREAQEKWIRFYNPKKDSEETSLNIASTLPNNQTLKKQAMEFCKSATSKFIADIGKDNDISEAEIKRINELKPAIKKAMIRQYEMEAEAEKVGMKIAKLMPDHDDHMLFSRCGIMRIYERLAYALNE